MKVFSSLENLEKFNNPVAAIGSFDGVHLGHQQIFNCLKENTTRLQGESIVITFEPHPQEVLYRGSDFFRITNRQEKTALIEKQNIDNLIIIPFTNEFAKLPFQEFMQTVLIDKIGIKALVMGPNHSIGKNREGTADHISEYALEKGIEIISIPEYLANDCSIRSQKIRELIKNGELQKASKLLGYDLK